MMMHNKKKTIIQLVRVYDGSVYKSFKLTVYPEDYLKNI